jgi:hypothetical protein
VFAVNQAKLRSNERDDVSGRFGGGAETELNITRGRYEVDVPQPLRISCAERDAVGRRVFAVRAQTKFEAQALVTLRVVFGNHDIERF